MLVARTQEEFSRTMVMKKGEREVASTQLGYRDGPCTPQLCSYACKCLKPLLTGCSVFFFFNFLNF